ncbi:MAG: IPT/TIG domain-containing protein [Anaeromyxobacteraceae bacterium]
MAPIIDVSTLDVRSALDFAIMVEEDAQLGYERLASVLGDDPGGAGAVCRMMVANEARHRRQLEARRDALASGSPPRIAVSIMDAAGVEAPDGAEDALPPTMRAALELALAAERRAEAFYRAAAAGAADAESRALFEDLTREEEEHAGLLTAKIAAVDALAPLGDAPLPCAVVASAPAELDAYPDAALLATVLSRFDSATQVVAKSILVDGMRPELVAQELGITRRTVMRKLTRFVALARQHLAILLAVAAMSGCAGGPDDLGPGAARAGAEGRATSVAAQLQADGQGDRASRDGRAPAYGQASAGDEGAARGPDPRLPDSSVAPAPAEALARTPPAPQLQADGTQMKPQLANVSPPAGALEGGGEVLITGSGFTNVQVMFGRDPARVTSQSSNAITVLVPAGERAGPVSIVVTNRDGSYAVAAGAYAYQQ